MAAAGGEEAPLRCTLFLAVTRPALFMGVPVEAMLFCAMGGMVIGPPLTGDMVMVAPVGLALFAIARVISLHDPLVFRVMLAWVASRAPGPLFGPVSSRTWWGGLSVSPLAAPPAPRGLLARFRSGGRPREALHHVRA